ncbi:MAG: alpha/beta hydrolase [Methanobacterium sp.]|nr:alpha/beta hydrolase [Methanobacterium sp.]
MNRIELNSTDIFYEDNGTGYPVVLVHGMGSDHTVWQGIIPLLRDNYRVLALDLRGHGHSMKTPGPYTMELFSHDIYQFLESLNIDQAHFIGHSMGGSILLELALQHPGKIRSLTLISSFAFVDQPLKEIFLNLDKILEYQGFDQFFDACMELTYTSQFQLDNQEALHKIRRIMGKNNPIPPLRDTINACLEVNLIDFLGSIQIPSLIIAGAMDCFTPTYLGEKIQEKLPQSCFKIMEGVGHNLPVEKAHETYLIIMEFLEVIKIPSNPP